MSTRAKWSFGGMTLLIIFSWAFFPEFVTMRIPDGLNEDWSRRGTFGDSYGVFTSLFSALAFCGVAITLYLQSVQLSEVKRQEGANKAAQAIQIRMMATTALLNTLNLEVEHLAQRTNELKDKAGGYPLALADVEYCSTNAKLRTANKERDKLVIELRQLMASPMKAQAALFNEAPKDEKAVVPVKAEPPTPA